MAVPADEGSLVIPARAVQFRVDAGLYRFFVRARLHGAEAAVVIVPPGLAAVKAFLRGIERHHVVRRRQAGDEKEILENK